MTRLALLAPLLALMLTGCPMDPKPALAPIPAPAAVVVKIPQLVPLPPDATDPCPKPAPRPINTDVDLLQAADAFKVWGQCNANKLAAIKGAQP